MRCPRGSILLVAVLAGCGASHRAGSGPAPGPALAPAGWLRLTTHVSPRVRATCATAARATHLTVICPPLVPADGVTADHDMYGPQFESRDLYTMSFNNGQVPGHIHWEVGAGTLGALSAAEFDIRNWDATAPKHPARTLWVRRIGGHVITMYRFPDNDGQLEGHDAALATLGRVTYMVSIHGHDHDPADVAMLVAILRRAQRIER